MTPNNDSEAPAIIAANASTSNLFWGHNGEWWDGALIVALIMAAIVAGAVVVMTAGSIISHKREAEQAKADLEAFKLATDARVAEADAKLKEAVEHTAKLAVELEQAKNAAKQIDANLLHEQRLTANERWRLERVERAVLPRSDFVDWNKLGEELKTLNLTSISIVMVGSKNLDTVMFLVNLTLAFRQAGVTVSTFSVEKVTEGLIQTTTGVTTLTVDAKGQALAQMLWQKFQIGGGSSSIFPDTFVGIPKDVNCLVVGPRDGGVGPGSGQPGEGLDPQGRPVPAP